MTHIKSVDLDIGSTDSTGLETYTVSGTSSGVPFVLSVEVRHAQYQEVERQIVAALRHERRLLVAA